MRRTSGTAWPPRAPSGGPCRRASRLSLKCGFPQSLVECPRLRLPALDFGRQSLLVARARRVFSSSWRALSALLSASLWAWMAATLLSADSFASASLVAWVSSGRLAPLGERLYPPEILFAPFLRAAAGRLELGARDVYLTLLRLYDVLEFQLLSAAALLRACTAAV